MENNQSSKSVQKAPTYVFISSTNEWGGIERLMQMLIHKLCQRDVQVHLLLIRDGLIPYPDELSPKVTVSRITKSIGDLFLAKRITKFLATIERPVILLFKLNDAHVFAKITSRHPQFAPHFIISSTLKKGLGRNPRIVKQVAATMSKMRKLICVSQGVAQHISTGYGINSDRLNVIYTPLIDQMAVQEPDDCSHPWLSETAQSLPTYIAAGRLVSAKDFTTLIKAFSMVCKKQESRLIILGEGMLRAQLENQISEEGLIEKVSLPGFVNHPKSYMRRATAFVLSSKNEGLPSVLIEALQSGTRVVSTDCPNGPREILLDGKLGPLVKPGDAAALAEAMLTTLTTPAPDPNLVAESLKRFDADLITDQYLKLGQDLYSSRQ